MVKRHSAVTLESLDRKLDSFVSGLDARFDGVDARFDGVDVRFDGVDVRFDGVDARLDGVDRRLDRLDAKTDETKRHAMVLFEATKVEIRQVAESVGALTGKVDKISEQLDRVDGRMVGNTRDIDILKVAYGDLDKRVARLEDAPGR